MPRSVPLAITLFLLTIAFSLQDINLTRLLFATPFLALEGFILFKIVKRRHWARLAMLVLVVYLDYSIFTPSYLSWLCTYIFGDEPRYLPVWYVMQPMLITGVQVTAVACLFSKSANTWYRGDSSTPKANESPISS